MNLIDGKRELKRNMRAGNATMMVSGSGLGKSSVLLQTFDEWAKGFKPGEVGLGVSFAASMNPVDGIGMPWKGTHTFPLPDGSERTINVTEPACPLWLLSTEGKPAWCYKHFYWICEEYNHAGEDTKRFLAEILLTGSTSYWRGDKGMPPGSVRVAATNVGSRYGATRDFDFAVARRTVMFIEGNAKVTVDHLDKPYLYNGRVWNTTGFTKSWALRNATVLFEEEPKVQGPWCHPRALCSVDRYLQMVMEDENGAVPINDPDKAGPIREMVANTMGANAANKYLSDLQFLTEIPSYSEIVQDPQGVEVPTKADLLLLMVYELASRTERQHLPQVIQFMSRKGIPQDMCITYVTALLRRDYKNIINEPAMDAWINKHAHLLTLIGSLTA